MEGLKYTMDGAADGYDIKSSTDEFIHNIIAFHPKEIDIHSNEQMYSFRFDINKIVVDPVDKLIHGVSV